MADRQVGITITIKGGAKAALKGVGEAAKGAMAGVRKLGEAGKAAMAGFGAAVVVANQGLELGRKALELWRAGVVETINKALEFRNAALDPMVRDFQALQKESELVRARLGDALLPVVVGLSKALGAATGSVSGLIAENQKLIGSNLVGWIESVSNGLVTGIGGAVILISKAWNGWLLIVDSVRLGVNRMFQGVLSGASSALDALASVSRFLGLEGIAGAADSVSQAAADFGAEFERSGDEAAGAIETTAAEMESFEATVRRVQASARSAIRAGAKVAMEEVAKATTGANQRLEEQAAAAERFKAIWGGATSKVSADFAAFYEKQAAMLEADVKAQEAASQATAEAWTGAAISISESLGTAFVEAALESNTLAETTKTAAKEVVKQIIAMASRVIIAYAAQAAAAQFAANAFLPVVGLVVGAGAAAAAFGAVSAWVERLQGGGVIQGGVPGRDSVPALLTPGERVLTKEEDGLLMRFMRTVSRPRPSPGTRTGLPTFQGGGVVRSGMGAGATTMGAPSSVAIQLAPQTLPSSRAQTRRLLLSIDREARDMMGRGLIFGGLQMREGTL